MVLVATIAACGGTSASEDDATTDTTHPPPLIIQPGAPGEPSAILTPEYVASLEPLPHTDADIVFMEMMIQHHEQALEMTGMVDERTESDDIPLLAQRMDISQTDEIQRMKDWIEARKDIEPATAVGEGHEHETDEAGEMVMEGYLTDAQMAELEAAEGAEFDELFLEFMIQHHLGAMKMVTDLIDAGGGQEAEIGVMTNHIYSDQEIEVLRMQQMLAERRGETWEW